MPKHIVKCPFCKETFDVSIEEYELYHRRYYHKECFKKSQEGHIAPAMAENREKKEKRVKNPNTDQDILNNYCIDLFGEDNYDPKSVMMVANQMITQSKNTYTFKGIYYTLYYVYEVLGLSVAKANNNIRIVPYYYTRAQKYFERIAAAQKVNEDKEAEKYKAKDITIYIDKPERKVRQKELFSFLDEDDVEEDNDEVIFNFI